MNKYSKACSLNNVQTSVGTAVLELLMAFLLGRKNLWMKEDKQEKFRKNKN